jgi:hypothetical protein
LAKQIHIIRLNIQSRSGMELAPVYGFEFTPTFIFFDEARAMKSGAWSANSTHSRYATPLNE